MPAESRATTIVVCPDRFETDIPAQLFIPAGLAAATHGAIDPCLISNLLAHVATAGGLKTGIA